MRTIVQFGGQVRLLDEGSGSEQRLRGGRDQSRALVVGAAVQAFGMRQRRDCIYIGLCVDQIVESSAESGSKPAVLRIQPNRVCDRLFRVPIGERRGKMTFADPEIFQRGCRGLHGIPPKVDDKRKRST
ncbi:hypothetical protein ACW2Q0_20880 [Nocardia sp. R16R-3T]